MLRSNASAGHDASLFRPSWWRNGGDFEIGGQRFRVRANGWGSKYRTLDPADKEIALVERAGRKHWSMQASGRTYEFRRASWFSSRQELIDGGRTAGTMRRISAWSGGIEADLPTLPLPLQVVVVGVQLALWQAQQAAAG